VRVCIPGVHVSASASARWCRLQVSPSAESQLHGGLVPTRPLTRITETRGQLLAGSLTAAEGIYKRNF